MIQDLLGASWSSSQSSRNTTSFLWNTRWGSGLVIVVIKWIDPTHPTKTREYPTKTREYPTKTREYPTKSREYPTWFFRFILLIPQKLTKTRDLSLSTGPNQHTFASINNILCSRVTRSDCQFDQHPRRWTETWEPKKKTRGINMHQCSVRVLPKGCDEEYLTVRICLNMFEYDLMFTITSNNVLLVKILRGRFGIPFINIYPLLKGFVAPLY